MSLHPHFYDEPGCFAEEEEPPLDGHLDAEQQIVLFFCLLACLQKLRMQTAEPPFDGHLDGSTLDPEIREIFDAKTYGEQKYAPLTECHPELGFLPCHWRSVHIREDRREIEVFYTDGTPCQTLTVTPQQYIGLQNAFNRIRSHHHNSRELTAERLVMTVRIRRRSEAERNWPQ